ncbi:hypothetical protein IFM89_019177 [Coptis chinensis]|uniref:Uncharacterized protein n=1 Tax=Coptis chinensis TaxID=261450 RepID=A0A835GZR4_9MAGN|nr:hypothetical protein IFM89_019177 [Coptis chinensis]
MVVKFFSYEPEPVDSRGSEDDEDDGCYYFKVFKLDFGSKKWEEDSIGLESFSGCCQVISTRSSASVPLEAQSVFNLMIASGGASHKHSRILGVFLALTLGFNLLTLMGLAIRALPNVDKASHSKCLPKRSYK